jgi:hypothetical protein
VYEGQFRNGSWNGHGKLVRPGLETYEGEFKNGDYSGLGRITWENGDWYEGPFSAGAVNGEGLCSIEGAIGTCTYDRGSFVKFVPSPQRELPPPLNSFRLKTLSGPKNA